LTPVIVGTGSLVMVRLIECAETERPVEVRTVPSLLLSVHRRRASQIIGRIGDGQIRAGVYGRQSAAGGRLCGADDERGKGDGEDPGSAGEARRGDHTAPPLVVAGGASGPARTTAASMLVKLRVDSNLLFSALLPRLVKSAKLPSLTAEMRRRTGFSTEMPQSRHNVTPQPYFRREVKQLDCYGGVTN
jgi:hypothetical protein